MNRQGIEGVADHLRVVAIRPPSLGERTVDTYSGEVTKWAIATKRYFPVVEPDNVYGVYDLADVKIPTGYEFMRFDEPEDREHYVSRFNKSAQLFESEYERFDTDDQRRILIKPIAKKTRRFVIAEQELYVDAVVQAVEGRFGGSTVAFPLKFRVEEREIETERWMD